jgi:hypothetical protein
MEQASEESQNEDRNDGKYLDWELCPDAPFWMLEPQVPFSASRLPCAQTPQSRKLSV